MAERVMRVAKRRHVLDGRHPRFSEPVLGKDQQPQDDHDAEPERRNGDARDAEGAHRVVDPGVLLDRGNDAQGNCDGNGDNGRHDRHLHGQLEAQPDLVADGSAGPHGVAKIESQVAADEVRELGVETQNQGLVEAEILPAELDFRRVGVQTGTRQPDFAHIPGNCP
jgi:hypothetical protein